MLLEPLLYELPRDTDGVLELFEYVLREFVIVLFDLTVVEFGVEEVVVVVRGCVFTTEVVLRVLKLFVLPSFERTAPIPFPFPSLRGTLVLVSVFIYELFVVERLMSVLVVVEFARELPPVTVV